MQPKNEMLTKKIVRNLAILSRVIGVENSLGYNDKNRSVQTLYAGLFSLVFGYKNLQDLDRINATMTYPAIDLGDEIARVAVQITVDGSKDKIQGTLDTFFSKGFDKKYDRLLFYIIGKKTASRANFEVKEGFSFDHKRDVIDDAFLAKEIQNKQTQDLHKIDAYLVNEVDGYINPDAMTDEDIKDGILYLKERISDLLTESMERNRVIDESIVRQEDHLLKKNEINNLSSQYFEEKLRADMAQNPKIIQFLGNPINTAIQDDYFAVTRAIHQHYLKNATTYENFEAVFSNVVLQIKYGINDVDIISLKKLRTLLHNMYINCDIGINPE